MSSLFAVLVLISYVYTLYRDYALIQQQGQAMRRFYVGLSATVLACYLVLYFKIPVLMPSQWVSNTVGPYVFSLLRPVGG